MKDEKGSLELTYKGDMEEHLSEWFDSRIEVLEWEVKQRKQGIERAERRIKELKSKKYSMDTWPQEKDEIDRKISSLENKIKRYENEIKEPYYEMIGWLYEIKHEIMKID